MPLNAAPPQPGQVIFITASTSSKLLICTVLTGSRVSCGSQDTEEHCGGCCNHHKSGHYPVPFSAC